MELQKEQFIQIRDLICEKSGLFFDEKKIYFVKKRIEHRLKSLGFSDPLDYCRYLKRGKNVGELNCFIEALTTNETYFFREPAQLESFGEEALPLIAKEHAKRGLGRRISVWSAGCSTGEEPYTLAMMVKENSALGNGWEITILGSDINDQALASAARGQYGERSVKNVPPKFLKKYFTKTPSGYNVNDEIKGMVTLKNVNLIDKSQMRRLRNVDFIFCRNVLIYFSDESRRRVLNYFYDSMTQGGFIFLGHSESVGRISAAYRLVRLKSSLAYRK